MRDDPMPGGDRHLTRVGSAAAFLAEYRPAVEAALADLDAGNVVSRIWDHDHTVWKPESAEIANRLGWLRIAEAMRPEVLKMQALGRAVRSAGYTNVLLLGMGGSSLAPELFGRTFGGGESHLALAVLDSTDPGAVMAAAADLDPARTLFIVATKSGGTVETLSFFKYFYNRTLAAVGPEQAGEHFVAITDPGSKLVDLAARHTFRAIFLSDPNIGGRYSALSHFGLVPAALVDIDLPRLLSSALIMAAACGPGAAVTVNPGLWLGAIIGELAKAGRDKLTIVTSMRIASFGDWLEQLVAESSGKEGQGILPVVGEPLGRPEEYHQDRLFVLLTLAADASHDEAVAALQAAGHPVVRLRIDDPYDLGGQFFLWELATAVAGQRLGINPFDQPDVEAAKILARQMVVEYMDRGALPSESPAMTEDWVAVYGDVAGATPTEAFAAFLGQARAGDYISIQAFVQPTAAADTALQALRLELRHRYGLATTVGYGPRYLHSTGQLHKGDRGNGLFIQVTADAAIDIFIPDEAGAPAASMSFGVLEAAQAMGDRRALLGSERRVLRLHLAGSVAAGIARLAAGVSVL